MGLPRVASNAAVPLLSQACNLIREALGQYLQNHSNIVYRPARPSAQSDSPEEAHVKPARHGILLTALLVAEVC